MKRAIKKRWIKALRSGRYKQIQGCLQSSDGNCCLGVLCRVLRLPHIQLDKEHIAFAPKGTNMWNSHNVPDLTREEIGLSLDEQTELVSMNDNKGYSFAQIAYWIGEHL